MDYSSTNSASLWHHANRGFTRSLNETLDKAKEQAAEKYSGLKNLVERNMVLSITIAVVVFGLLVLCCYLRRKYSRSAQVVSRREYRQILKKYTASERLDGGYKQRSRHLMEGGTNSESFSNTKELDKRKSRRKDRNRYHDVDEKPPLNPNESMETAGTATSNEINFVDMESGQGFEVEETFPVPIPFEEEQHHFDEQDVNEKESSESPKKTSFFSRKKAQKKGTDSENLFPC